MKISPVFAISAGIFCTISAFAQNSSVEGTATAADGKPEKNAQVSFQMESGKSRALVTKTDAKGHFALAGLPPGAYKVTVLVNGVPRSAMAHVKVVPNKSVTLKIDGKRADLANASAGQNKPKLAAHWVASTTGTHLGGHYEDDNGNRVNANGQSMDSMTGSELQHIQTSHGAAPAGGSR